MTGDQMWNEALAKAEQIVARKDLEQKLIKAAIQDEGKHRSFRILMGGILPPNMTVREICAHMDIIV